MLLVNSPPQHQQSRSTFTRTFQSLIPYFFSVFSLILEQNVQQHRRGRKRALARYYRRWPLHSHLFLIKETRFRIDDDYMLQRRNHEFGQTDVKRGNINIFSSILFLQSITTRGNVAQLYYTAENETRRGNCFVDAIFWVWCFTNCNPYKLCGTTTSSPRRRKVVHPGVYIVSNL